MPESSLWNLTIGGEEVGQITSFHCEPQGHLDRLYENVEIPSGRFDITGTLTCTFVNSALLKKYSDAGMEHERLVQIASTPSPPKFTAWTIARRVVGYAALALGLLLLPTAAGAI